MTESGGRFLIMHAYVYIFSSRFIFLFLSKSSDLQYHQQSSHSTMVLNPISSELESVGWWINRFFVRGKGGGTRFRGGAGRATLQYRAAPGGAARRLDTVL